MFRWRAMRAMGVMGTIPVAALLIGGALATGAEPVDYARDIQPLLASRCTSCHGRTKQQNSLRLDHPATILKGGDSGPAIVAGKGDESLLIRHAIGSDDFSKMPPEGPSLSAQEIALIARWINDGAKAPDEVVLPVIKSNHWVFQPPAHVPLPKVSDMKWGVNPIDYFVLARLDQEGLRPSAEAARETLIRRLSLDLRGLPPTVDEIDEFLSDDQPDAYHRLVDRYLAAPAYGERWGRLWLDVARYADSNGFTRDFGREIWKYRDWVINAVNADLPFDQFTIEQFAGDMLPDATLDQIVATGFHRNTLVNEEGGTDQEQFRVDAVADRVDTTGVAFLGLTLGCARCHEHKYDPISQREYYELFAFLNNCEEPRIDAPYDWQVSRGIVDERNRIRQQIAAMEESLKAAEAQIMAAQLAFEKTVTPEQRVRLVGPVQAALDKAPDKRDETEKKLIRDHFQKQDVARQQFPQIDAIEKLRATEPNIPTAMVMRERKDPRPTHIHRRGNFLDQGVAVQPSVPSVLHALPMAAEKPSRLDFARWLVSAENPLTPRVVMNRHWQHFFGRGIVETENDFGIQGTPPSHPELLDWLALEFRESWSTKQMHRAIVTSATYRQSSRMTAEQLARDPYNKLLARQSRLRLDAEIIRDTALSAGGLLTYKIGGPGVHPPQPDGIYLFTQDPKPWNTETGEDRFRRGMYTQLWRSSPYPSMTAFDFPDSNTTCTRRVRSNTPIQALVLANDVQFIEAARALAVRSFIGEIADWPDRIDLAFRTTLGRRPTSLEQNRVLEIVTDQMFLFLKDKDAAKEFAGDGEKTIPTARFATWTAVCRVLLCLDEFVTRE